LRTEADSIPPDFVLNKDRAIEIFEKINNYINAPSHIVYISFSKYTT
jgi:hypothetical protein